MTTFRLGMFIERGHVQHMTVMIQAQHRRLKSRAALAGMSLSDYLLCGVAELAALLQTPRVPLARRKSCEYEIRQPGRLVTHSRAGRTASLIARRPDREKE
jgi:hypothetical protein